MKHSMMRLHVKQTDALLPLLGPATFTMLHYVTGSLLAAGQSVIVEGFFGLSEVGKAEFLQLQQMHDFEPFQIQCKTDGSVLLKRFLARAGSAERHICHRDLEFVERNKERMLQGIIRISLLVVRSLKSIRPLLTVLTMLTYSNTFALLF